MSHEVLLTGFGVRTAFGTGADALREGVFEGTPAFAPITRFDTGPYRTGLAATCGGAVPLREVLAEVAGAAVAMAGLRPGTEAAVLVGTAGDFTALTPFWRTATGRGGAPSPGDSSRPGPADGAWSRTGAVSPGPSGDAPAANSQEGPAFPGSPGRAVSPGSPGVTATPRPPGLPGGAVSPGNDATDPPGGTPFPGSPGGTASPGGMAPAGAHSSAASSGSRGGATHPGSPGSAASPGGTASSGSPGGATSPCSPGSTPFPGWPGSAASPASPGRTPLPSQPGGAASSDSPGSAPQGHGRAAGADRAVETVPAWQAEALGDALGVHGTRLAFTNACVASASAVAHGCRLIASGRADIVICAGAYLVEEENLAKFGSGFALSRDGMVRPFCADRSGLLLGDGAAAVVLESADSARRRGARVLGALTGWGVASDAHHIARPHPEGTGLVTAARRALRRAGSPRIDYVNAHGTATKSNDPAETRGLHTLFGADAPHVPVSSTKSTTGHLLEASGVVELVITLLALRDGVLPPTAGFTEPDPHCDLDYVPNRPRKADIRHALTVNAAFGGANSALVLERA
ncbi:beta-ketoacyl synthase N-terminal-like domain-containing protein [Streptomyces sp. NPDC021212]|uniref:beta-ketoacyl-[acyl-carrier-protein] synthase family protein n=1 Tax=Streptomyces sp. NPDC021212 TaxID=3365118 RepID=UPI003799AFB9